MLALTDWTSDLWLGDVNPVSLMTSEAAQMCVPLQLLAARAGGGVASRSSSTVRASLLSVITKLGAKWCFAGAQSGQIKERKDTASLGEDLGCNGSQNEGV
ncbi:hypothetical protein WMY93_028255 [Mugilogobius chulae]|uniref:Uncharacterized protein n=1 Tax=Mugilogobius chulae TaxID=88201 RepID=A0AAW0MSB1_9GOBI